MAIDWVVVSSLGTAVGTLGLAGATVAFVRSSAHAARVAERALMAGLRPLLMPSRLEDPEQIVGFSDEYQLTVGGGAAVAEITDSAIYLTLSLRNAGSGLAVLDGWYVITSEDHRREHAALKNFIKHNRDLYVGPGEHGFWQGALREPGEPVFDKVRKEIEGRERFTVELLYGDLEGGQRTISRFSFVPVDGDGWTSAVVRHWHLDAPDPR